MTFEVTVKILINRMSVYTNGGLDILTEHISRTRVRTNETRRDPICTPDSEAA